MLAGSALDVRKSLAEIDLEILEGMKRELDGGNLVVNNYIATSEDDGYEGRNLIFQSGSCLYSR